MLQLLLFLGMVSCTQSKPALELKSLYDGKVEILVPSTFNLMDEELKRSKYARTSNPPEYVFTNKNADINLVLQVKQDEQMLALGLEGALDGMIKQIKVDYLDKGLTKFHNRDFAYMIFRHKGADKSVIYNYMCYTIVDKDFYFVSFNATDKHWSQWESTVKEIMGSIKIK